MNRLWIALLLLLCSPALAYFHGSAVTGGGGTCPFGSSGVDGCGLSPGLYFAPASSSTIQPNPAQFSTYARQSGQTWTTAWTSTTHPQTWNLSGIDYGVGPNVLVPTLTDIASWNSNTSTVSSTNCAYLGAAGVTETFTANVSGTTMTYLTGTKPLVGTQLVVATGISATTLIVANPSGNTFTLSRSAFFSAGATETATDTYQLSGWSSTSAALVCAGAPASPFTITGFNFGPTSTQGTPVGTHDCVALVFQSTGTETITISNDAWTNGTGCQALVGGVNYGMVSAETQSTPLIIENLYVDGQSGSACCSDGIHGAQFFFALNNQKSNLTYEFNWVHNIPATVGYWSPLTSGSDPTCSNGTVYNTPGYYFTDKFNYTDGFITTFGAGHIEIFVHALANSTTYLCSRLDDYNTVLYPSTTVAEGAATFFGNNSASGSGTMEYWEVENNTIIANLTGGAQVPNTNSVWSWHTSGGTPNLLVVDAYTSGPNLFSGAANNSGTNPIGLQNMVSGGTSGPGNLIGSTWNIGCNQTGGTLCLSGESINVAPGVVVSTNSSTWYYAITSRGGAEADHGVNGGNGYGALYWINNYFDGTGTNGASGPTGPSYWSAQPAGTCGQAITTTGNIELTTNGTANTISPKSGGC